MTEKEAIREIKRWTNILMNAGSQCTLETAEAQKIAIKTLKEIRQYRSIGTVKECQAAMEKQKPQPPDIWGDGCDKEGNIIYEMYDCPGCGQSYEIDDKYKYCPECGQALNWRGFEKLYKA